GLKNRLKVVNLNTKHLNLNEAFTKASIQVLGFFFVYFNTIRSNLLKLLLFNFMYVFIYKFYKD
ncbi:hypothetical protein LRB42_05990, partial [Borreliella burgdorferi]|uniref:hypothetical protein n=1 Tax=Borreliella burgdorferi TaxID=139 RepID=UPI001E34185F